MLTENKIKRIFVPSGLAQSSAASVFNGLSIFGSNNEIKLHLFII